MNLNTLKHNFIRNAYLTEERASKSVYKDVNHELYSNAANKLVAKQRKINQLWVSANGIKP